MNFFVKNFLTLANRFMWSSRTVTRTAPHIRDANNVQRLWNTFVFASIPAWLVGMWSLGHQTNIAIADFQLESVPGWRAWVLNQAGIGFDPYSMVGCAIHGMLYFFPVFFTALLTGAFWESLFATVRRQRVDEGLLANAEAVRGRPATPVSYAGVARRSTVGAGAPGVGVTPGVGAGAPGVGVAPGNAGVPVNRVGVR